MVKNAEPDLYLYGDGTLVPVPEMKLVIGPCILDAFCSETAEMGINPTLQMQAIEDDPVACKILQNEGIF